MSGWGGEPAEPGGCPVKVVRSCVGCWELLGKRALSDVVGARHYLRLSTSDLAGW